LRGEVRAIFFEWLRSYRPDLVPRYEALYRRGAYAPEGERRRLSSMVKDRDGPSRWRDAGEPEPNENQTGSMPARERRQATLF
jgi:hypothetical protein